MATAKGHSSPDGSGPLDVNVSAILEFSNLDTEGLIGCLKSKQILDEKTERLIREDCWRGRGLLETAAPMNTGAMLTHGFHGQAISDIFHFISNLTTPGIVDLYKKKMEEIKNCEVSRDDLCDRTKVVWIPWPSNSPALPTDRFHFGNDSKKIKYFGRDGLADLLTKVTKLGTFQNGKGALQIYIHGEMGIGKSHMMCAIAYHLMKEGKPVVFLADTRILIRDPFGYLQDALLLAFSDNPIIRAKLENIDRNQEALWKICDEINKNGVKIWFFLDQLNSFEADLRSSEDVRKSVRSWIDGVTSRHYLVMSSTGNCEMAHSARWTAENVEKVYMWGGLTDDEQFTWWKKNMAIHKLLFYKNLSENFKRDLQDRSGMIPFLLDGVEDVLQTFTQRDEQDMDGISTKLWTAIYEHKTWTIVKSHIADFVLTAKLDEKNKKNFFDAMEHCILGHKLSSEVWRYVDNRYFQILADTTHVSSGHARECAAFYLRKYSDAGRFLSKVWYAALYECGKQPSVLGFIVENIILSYVPEMGITIDGKTLTGFKATQFGMIPNFATEDLQKPLLLVPFAGNFKAIDCIIAWVQDRVLKIAAVKITVNIKHENSELAFRSEWSKILPNESHQGGSNTLYDTIEPLFIWIVEEPDNFRLQPMTVRETTYHTEYRRVVLDVVSVCPDLKDGLHAARKEQADSKKEVQREKQKVAQENEAEGKAGADSKEEVGHGKKKARGGKAKRQKENVEAAEDSDADASVLVERAVKRRKRNRTKK